MFTLLAEIAYMQIIEAHKRPALHWYGYLSIIKAPRFRSLVSLDILSFRFEFDLQLIDDFIQHDDHVQLLFP